MNTEDPTDETSLQNQPQEITYEQFLNGLTGYLNKVLNPNGEKKAGFVCFIFPVEDPTRQASVISNCQKQVFFPLLRKYTSRLLSKYRKQKVN